MLARNFVIILFFLSSTLIGQSIRPTLKTGPSVSGATSEFSEFLEVIDGKIYQTGSSKNSFLVSCLDERTYNKEYEVEIPKSLAKWQKHFVYMKPHHGYVDAFYKVYDSEANKFQLKYSRVDKNGSLSNVKLIDEFEAIEKKKGGFWHRFSKDNEKVVVLGYHADEPEDRKKYTVAVYDWNYNVQWKTEHTLPYTVESFDLEDLQITNNGEVIIAGSYEDGGKKGMTMFKLMESDIKELLIEPEINSFVSMDVKSDVLLGKTQFYSWMTRDEVLGYDGYVMITVDNGTFEIENEVVEEFNKELLSTLTYEDRQFGKSRPFLDFDFKDILPKSDGGFYIIAEKNYEEVVTMKAENGGSSNSYTYYDLDVVVMSMDNKGNVEFLSLVPKFQKVKSGKNYYTKSSYGSLVDSKDRLHLFFNDVVENLNFKPGGDRPEIMKRPEKCVVMQYVIDVDGSGQKSQFKANGKDFIPEFRESLSLGNTLLFVAQTGRRDIQYYTLSVR